MVQSGAKKGCLVFMLVIVLLVMPSVPGAMQQQANQAAQIGRIYKSGLVFGHFDTEAWNGSICTLVAGYTPTQAQGLFMAVPSRFHAFHIGERIQLVNPKLCYFHDTFVLGFCRIVFTKTKLDMHIVSIDQTTHTVTWVVDQINGAPVYKDNLVIVVRDSFGKLAGATAGQFGPSYLRTGDTFFARLTDGGNYQVTIKDDVTGRILFHSPLLQL